MTNHSTFFRELADKIDRNPGEDFGGAFMLMPPKGDPVSGLIVGAADVAMFWGLVKTKIDVALAELSIADAQQGIRRR